jgi:hypothetical protein
MLTTDDIVAILRALDLAHVTRIILVGDPNQLPPIGAGRPFADLVGFLELAKGSTKVNRAELAGALSRLTVEVRSANKAGFSDSLRLASWFTREPQLPDADRVLSDLELGSPLNDLDVCLWQTPDQLREKLVEQIQKCLSLSGPGDVAGFNRALGFDNENRVKLDEPGGAENFQILSPVRLHPHGTYELNRLIQRMFRKTELDDAANPNKYWSRSFGDEQIVLRDKVIQIRNQTREGYHGGTKEKPEVYLANGEIGLVASQNNRYINVAFARHSWLTFGYGDWDFSKGGAPLELAYALTVHKSQGSEFATVFVVLPKNCKPISRELLYTAVTRSRSKLVLLIEGQDVGMLYDLSRPEKSETIRRNTNLFVSAVRERMDVWPYAEYLIHRTERGDLVRSKSELVIANKLFQLRIDYHYERPLEGDTQPGRLRPDFSFIDAAGDLVLWEHLGLMSRPGYRSGWQWKLNWYKQNGFELGRNLFTTEDDAKGGLDMRPILETAGRLKALL